VYCYSNLFLLLFTRIIVELDRNKDSNAPQSDYKYPSDFRFRKKCQIPSDSESVTSVVKRSGGSIFCTNSR